MKGYGVLCDRCGRVGFIAEPDASLHPDVLPEGWVLVMSGWPALPVGAVVERHEFCSTGCAAMWLDTRGSVTP